MPPAEVSRKLKIPEGNSYRVMNAPAGYDDNATDGGDKQVDVVHLFAHNRAELQRRFPAAFKALKPGGAFWVSYPADGEDLSRNHGWGVLHSAGDMSGTEMSAVGRRVGRGSRGHAKMSRPMATERLAANGDSIVNFCPRSYSC